MQHALKTAGKIVYVVLVVIGLSLIDQAGGSDDLLSNTTKTIAVGLNRVISIPRQIVTDDPVISGTAGPTITAAGCTEMRFDDCADLDTSTIAYDPRDSNLDGQVSDIEAGA